MEVVRLSVYELTDLKRFLEQLKRYKELYGSLDKKGNDHFDTTKYDIHLINILLERCDGKYIERSLQTNEYRQDINTNKKAVAREISTKDCRKISAVEI